MLFEVRTAYDKDTVANFVRVTNRTINKTKMLVLRIFLLLLGVAGIGGGAALLILQGMDVRSVLLVVLGVVFLLTGVFFLPYQIWRTQKSVSTQVKEILFTFREDAFTVGDEWKKTGYEYKVLQFLCENGGYYFLFVNSKVGYILRKSDFVTGSAEEFRVFLEERTGKPVAFVD